MATDRQCAANRANAAHSTGPRTPEGKAASKFNRLSHGLDSGALIIPGERAEEWEIHRAGMRDSLAPVGPFETELADRAAALVWRLRRVVRYETGAVTAAVDHAVALLAGGFEPGDSDGDTFGQNHSTPAPHSVVGLRNQLADQRAELDLLSAGAALLRDLPTLPDDHRLGPAAGWLLDGICEAECLTSITDIKAVEDLDLPDEAWDDLIGWDGWTAGIVRAVLAEIGKRASRTQDQLLNRAGRRTERETATRRAEVARQEEALARAEADFAEAAELVRQANLLPTQATNKVIRYEAHLSRQLTQTYQLLNQLKTARAAGQLNPPVTDGWESGCVPSAGSEAALAERTQSGAAAGKVPSAGSVGRCADRTQSGPVGSPLGSVEPVSSTGRVGDFADRTQFGPTGSPVVAAEPVSPPEWVVVSADRTQLRREGPPKMAAGRSPFTVQAGGSADRTQFAEGSPPVIGSDPVSGRPDQAIGQVW